MTPERWRRIEEIFQTIAEHPATEREARLTQGCGDDEELRTEVASLLSHQVEDSFIQSAMVSPGFLVRSGQG